MGEKIYQNNWGRSKIPHPSFSPKQLGGKGNGCIDWVTKYIWEVKISKAVVNWNFAYAFNLSGKLFYSWFDCPFFSTSSSLISAICCALSFLKISFLWVVISQCTITKCWIWQDLDLCLRPLPVCSDVFSESLSRQGHLCNQSPFCEGYKNMPCLPRTCFQLRQAHFQMKAFI